MRIVTNADFDGVVCAVLLYEALGVQKSVKWVKPHEIQRGLVKIHKGDIIANLPYDERCDLWFDHHFSNRIDVPFHGIFKVAPSAAGVIFEYYNERFYRDYSELVKAADKIDSADLTLDEVLHPEKYAFLLLSMTTSSSDEPDLSYWNLLVDLFRKFEIQQVLQDRRIKKHCSAAVEQNEKYKDVLKENTRLEKHVSITDFRAFDAPPSGNRFLVYALFPESVVDIRIRYERQNKEEVVIQVGHSIINRSCKVNIGLMLADFGGGGHRGVGSCHIPRYKADKYILKILNILLKNENKES